MDKEWIHVHTVNFLPKAEILKQSLEQIGIATILLNLQDSAYGNMGDIKVFVKRDNVIKAKHFLIQNGNE